MEAATTAVPDRAVTQRMIALDKANRVRTARARMKRDLKAGKLAAIDVLRDIPEYAQTMTVFDLLTSTPRLGRVKANKVCMSMRFSPSRHLERLSERQRLELIAYLNSRQTCP